MAPAWWLRPCMRYSLRSDKAPATGVWPGGAGGSRLRLLPFSFFTPLRKPPGRLDSTSIARLIVYYSSTRLSYSEATPMCALLAPLRQGASHRRVVERSLRPISFSFFTPLRKPPGRPDSTCILPPYRLMVLV